jgi:pimeloyl-ACP methyl ester carboxylesterase
MEHPAIRQVQLFSGPIEYEDTGGEGPVIVLLHGLLMDASLWAQVIADLSIDHRCVAPTLPLGAHRHAMGPDADLSLPGVARLVVELLDRLDLEAVTLVGNDTGGAIVQLVGTSSPRVARAVLASCEAFDNFPARVTGTTLALAGRLPPSLFGLFLQQMRFRPLRRLPLAFGWLTMRGDAVTAGWMRPVLRQPEIRRDAVRALRAARADPGMLVEAATALADVDYPALVV